MNASPGTPAPFFDDELAVGTVLAGYRLVRILAAAEGRHTLYEGLGPAGERVAVRLVSRELSQDREFRNRFERLLALRSSITHPHLLPVLENGEIAGGRLYVVSRFSDAPTLSDLLARRPPAPALALRLLGQVGEALDAAHARGLVHPGLDPAEILVEQWGAGHALLTDFVAATPERSGSGCYRSPEDFRGEPLTPASDVYALTCVLVECLTGQPPAEPSVWAGQGHVVDPPPQPSRQRDDLPPAIDRVVATGMAKDPGGRFASCGALVAAAAEALEEQPLLLEEQRPPAVAVVGDEVWPETSPALPKGRSEADPWFGEAGTAGGAPVATHPVAREAEHGRWMPGSVRFVLAALGAGAVLGGGVAAIASDGDESAPEPSRSGQTEVDATRERAALVRRSTPPIERLATRRAAGRRRLARARNPLGQAAAAAGLSRVYRQAAGELDDAGAGRVAATVRRGGVGYQRLAAAARSGDTGRWRAASLAVRRLDSRLESELRSLGRPPA